MGSRHPTASHLARLLALPTPVLLYQRKDMKGLYLPFSVKEQKPTSVTMPKKTTDLEDMDNPDRTRYFQVIDELRGLGINEDLPLPQASSISAK